MRITGGKWASRRVSGPPRGQLLRPTPDALREQTFAIVGERVKGALFLDLFAGTGINALEALSRGASRAILVEHHPQALALIRTNFAHLGVDPGEYTLVPSRVSEALPWLAQQGVEVSLAWADPPFAHFSQHLKDVALLATLGVLRPEGLLVLETPPKAQCQLPGFVPLR
ncbi:MAG: RsmD family RNA methyltransferase, partial [Thermoanaerobaculum sp.]|nr:RsmD family RNA methyltransferase [Thermoanaerobaculum sp.]